MAPEFTRSEQRTIRLIEAMRKRPSTRRRRASIRLRKAKLVWYRARIRAAASQSGWNRADRLRRYHGLIDVYNADPVGTTHERLYGATGPQAAVRWALSKQGVTENPPGSNRGGQITTWQESFGDWLVGQPWCGVFVGCALRRAGVRGLNSRVAAVAFIEDDARAGINGWARLVGRDEGRAGDAVILFGRGVHVELIVKRTRSGYDTVGGNTSPGDGGSQNNGGGVYRRHRNFSQVHAVARPKFP